MGTGMPQFGIYAVETGPGAVAISPIPGRDGQFEADIAAVLDWGPSLVLSMTTGRELALVGAQGLPVRLAQAGVEWLHLPVEDFGAPDGETAEFWPIAAAQAHGVLNGGGRILAHCFGGQGRSGMIALRLLVERGEASLPALERLRSVRPGAVETEAQFAWAAEAETG